MKKIITFVEMLPQNSHLTHRSPIRDIKREKILVKCGGGEDHFGRKFNSDHFKLIQKFWYNHPSRSYSRFFTQGGGLQLGVLSDLKKIEVFVEMRFEGIRNPNRRDLLP